MKEQKQVFDHTRAEYGGCKTKNAIAIATQKKVFNIPHKELKNHELRVKRPLVACEPHFAHH